MKLNSCIYLLSVIPHFNPEKVRDFETFERKNSLLLYSSLIINYREVLQILKSGYSVKYCFNEVDRGFLPEEFSLETEIIFFDTGDKNTIIKELGEKYFLQYKNNLIIFPESIGVWAGTIHKVFSLINSEENSLVIGKSTKGKVIFIGFNFYEPEFLLGFDLVNFKFKNFLNQACRYDFFINVMNNFLSVSDVNDFKLLYQELSKKESLNYCSQKMHERFTNLFIEYKDLLK
jgi:hypothetical protein